jgi:DNA-binding protein HU-alpha
MPSANANIQDLITLVSRNCDITKAEAKVYIEATLQGIVQLATDRDKLTLREFGRFEMRHHKARINSKPIQGAPVVIPSRELLHFTPSKLLAVEVDY